MSLTHTTATRNTAVDAKLGLIDAGATNPNGQLVYMTSAGVEVATLDCSNPAFAAASGGAATANAITEDASATGGTIGIFMFVDRDGNEVFRGTVTATGGGGDIELSSVAISAGDKVQTTGFTYTEGA